MKMLKGMSTESVCIIFMLVFLFPLSAASITLRRVNNSLTTECTSGLVEGKDILHFTSQVPDGFDFVDYQIKTKHEPFFRTFCHLDSAVGSKQQDKCTVTLNGSITVGISIAANSSVSEASIRGRWHLGKTSIESETLTFPSVYDPGESGIFLHVNGLPLSTANCTLKLNESSISLLFGCNKQTPSPCTLRLEDGTNNQTLQNDLDLICLSVSIQNVLRLHFSYRFCHSEREMHFSCFFEKEKSTPVLSTGDSKDSSYMGGGFTSVLTLLFASLIINFIFAILLKREIKIHMVNTYVKIYTYWITRSITYEMAMLGLSCKPPFTDANQQQHNCNCYTSGRGGDYIDTADLQITSLEEIYRDERLVKLIQSVSKLTVQISFEKISASRVNKCWPGTEISYPMSVCDRTDLNARTGSGRVWCVTKYTDGVDDYGGKHPSYSSCPCSRCRNSDQPSTTWGAIKISTSASLVVDEVEAGSGFCRISLAGRTHDLTGFRTDRQTKIETDFCSLVTYSCDVVLVDELKSFLKSFNEIYKEPSLLKAYLGVVFVVSYPHDNKQKVSLGKLVRIENVRRVGTRLLYDARACPGSCGAPVTAIGFTDRWGQGTQFIHCGSVCEVNCSGFAELRQNTYTFQLPM